MSRAGFTLGEAVLLASSSSMIFFLGSDLFGEVVQPPAMGEPEKLLLLLLVKLSALDVGESSNRFQSVLVLLMLGLSPAKEDEICRSNYHQILVRNKVCGGCYSVLFLMFSNFYRLDLHTEKRIALANLP